MTTLDPIESRRKRSPRQQSPAPRLAEPDEPTPWAVALCNERVDAILIRVRDRLMREREGGHA